MRRTVKAWLAIRPDGTIMPCGDGYGTLSVTSGTRKDIESAYGMDLHKAVRCVVIYDDGKPARRARRRK